MKIKQYKQNEHLGEVCPSWRNYPCCICSHQWKDGCYMGYNKYADWYSNRDFDGLYILAIDKQEHESRWKWQVFKYRGWNHYNLLLYTDGKLTRTVVPLTKPINYTDEPNAIKAWFALTWYFKDLKI